MLIISSPYLLLLRRLLCQSTNVCHSLHVLLYLTCVFLNCLPCSFRLPQTEMLASRWKTARDFICREASVSLEWLLFLFSPKNGSEGEEIAKDVCFCAVCDVCVFERACVCDLWTQSAQTVHNIGKKGLRTSVHFAELYKPRTMCLWCTNQ